MLTKSLLNPSSLRDLMCLFFLSCFLLAMKDDSIEGIYDTLKQCALISKTAGGIGLAISCIRATGSYIAGVSEIQIKSSRYRTAFYCLFLRYLQ